MKFPQFIRTPKYKRFNIAPRYYDPIKEDIEIRTARIKGEIDQAKFGEYSSNIRGAFGRKVTHDSKAGLLRLLLFLLLFGGGAGYLFLGPRFLNVFFLLIPVYIYFKLRGGKKQG